MRGFDSIVTSKKEYVPGVTGDNSCIYLYTFASILGVDTYARAGKATHFWNCASHRKPDSKKYCFHSQIPSVIRLYTTP